MRIQLAGRSSLYLCVVFIVLGLSACATPFKDAYNSAEGRKYDGSDPPAANASCPDKATPTVGNFDTSKNWKMTSCEQAIVRAAIDYCVGVTAKTDAFENIWTRIEEGTNGLVALSAAAAGVAGLVASSPPVAIAGTATLIASLGGDLGKVFTGTQGGVTIASMYTAAQQYAQVNQNLAVPQDIKGTHRMTNYYYAGLWNAAGSACPSNVLGGGFRMAKIDGPEAVSPTYFKIAAAVAGADASGQSTKEPFIQNTAVEFDPKSTFTTDMKSIVTAFQKAYAADETVNIYIVGSVTSAETGIAGLALERAQYIQSKLIATIVSGFQINPAHIFVAADPTPEATGIATITIRK